jgi:hypothetical protein
MCQCVSIPKFTCMCVCVCYVLFWIEPLISEDMLVRS